MKTKIKLFVSMFFVICYSYKSYSQADVAGGTGHVRVNTYNLGWDGTGAAPGPLDIRNDFSGPNQPIDFYNGTSSTVPVMEIDATGNVGIGTTTPISLLHLNSSSAAVTVATLYTNPNTVNGLLPGGLQVGVADNSITSGGEGIIRHLSHKPIEVWTFGAPLTPLRRNATFTSDVTMENTFFEEGDGLRIHDPSGNFPGLDLWTSVNASITNIKWGPNGSIRGRNLRLEIQGEYDEGLWFNVLSPAVRTFFNSQGTENARIGDNTFWRIGANAGNVDATRRLEVVDDTDPQLRLTNDPTTPVFTDFQTTAAGNLLINPFNATTSKNVGINLTSGTTPIAKLHVNNRNERAGVLGITTLTTGNVAYGVLGVSTSTTQFMNIGVGGAQND